jgi:hypothetical protein
MAQKNKIGLGKRKKLIASVDLLEFSDKKR